MGTVLAVPMQAKALNVEACAANPMTSRPQVINLLRPLDSSLLHCIPELSSIAGRWNSQARRITAAVNRFKIGNNGKATVERLEYSPLSNTVSFLVSVRAAHTWKIPEVREQVPVDKWRWVEKKACLKIFGKKQCLKVKEKVPYLDMEWRTIIPESSASASARCNYSYGYNVTTGESRPVFSCDSKILGDLKLDASAVTALLRGEMPTMGQLLTAVDFTPPLFKDESRDAYQEVSSRMRQKHPDSVVYFSSESFVNWASTKNQAANVILTATSGGAYGAEFTRQIEERLRSEALYMATFASQTGLQLGADDITSMLTGKQAMRLNGFDVSVKAVNTPQYYQKCMVKPSRVCMPAIELPRLGFAIIATRT